MNSTVRDVAERAGVSAMTVSRVINGGSGVRPETKRRVEEAIRELEYVPNAVAKGLMSNKSGTIGVIVPDIVNPFFALVIRGAETVARRSGYRVLLCNTEGDLALERQYVEDMLAHRADGILIAPVSDLSKDHLAALSRRRFPFVLVDRSVTGLDCDIVQADSVSGARRLTEHLIEVGHRRIGLIIEPDTVSTARERVRGYHAALEKANLSTEESLIVRTSADRAGGYGATNQLLSLPDPPTALFGVNNMTALGAIDAVRDRGLSVPEDIGLVCFDDVEHLAVLSPFLTVMDQPTETFGTVGTQLLLDRIAGNVESGRRVVLPPRLIVRRSGGEDVRHNND
jgi:LacI family transcriptional regulator